MTDSIQVTRKHELSVDDLRSVAMAALERGGTVCVPADGVSMGAKLSRAEGLYVRSLSLGRIRCGSILVFRNGAGNWIAHRVIWLFRSHPTWFCVTKGDGYFSADLPFVRADQVIGEVAAIRYPDKVVPLDGFWGRAAQRVKGLSCLAVAALSEVIQSVGRRRWRLGGILNEAPEESG